MVNSIASSTLSRGDFQQEPKMHVAGSGIRAGQWVKCDAQQKCRVGGSHVAQSDIKNVQKWAGRKAFNDVTSEDYINYRTAQIAGKISTGIPINSVSLEEKIIPLFNALGKGKDSQIRVSKQGELPVRCKKCGDALTQKVYDELNEVTFGYVANCSHCGNPMKWGELTPPYIVDVDDKEAKFLYDDKAVMETSWYHITTSDNWHEQVLTSNVFVHLGTKQAALDRLIVLKQYDWLDGSNYKIYEIGFNNKVNVSENIFSDDNQWPVDLSEGKNNACSAHKVNRYVNEWEAPGSVSLIVSPKLFTVKSVETI